MCARCLPVSEKSGCIYDSCGILVYSFQSFENVINSESKYLGSILCAHKNYLDILSATIFGL